LKHHYGMKMAANKKERESHPPHVNIDSSKSS
jgi:hypothetical protein